MPARLRDALCIDALLDETRVARRWLASWFDGDALTDDLIREAARLLADAQAAQHAESKVPLKSIVPALERSERCKARWDDFKRRHGITARKFPQIFADIPDRRPSVRPLRPAVSATAYRRLG